jgi:topoisomerase IV subunit B
MASKPQGKADAGYGEASIRVLKGLEPVKQRPGMYTRTDNPLHIIQEVIDNAADEALAGFGKRIDVTVHADGSVSVEDDGRGIPFGLHPEEQLPVVEIVFTRLHAGGKFDKGAGGAYSFSGGLHGVGVSVTNALSKRLQVTVWREGQVAETAFAAGDVVEPLKTRRASSTDRKSGTTVRAWPDPKYFESAEFPKAELTHLLRSKAVLMPGVTVTLRFEKGGETQSWIYKGGLRDYLMQTLTADPVIPLFEGEHYADRGEMENFAEGEGAAWCVAFTEEGAPVRESYVNLIPTVAGGTHEAGLKDGLFGAVKGFIDLHSLLPKGVKLMPEDVFSRASFVLSAKVLDPQFQGQGARSAVPGPDQGAAQQPRCAQAGFHLRQARHGAVAQPACGPGPQAGGAGDPPGADAPAGQPEGGEAQGLGGGRAARKAHRLRKP